MLRRCYVFNVNDTVEIAGGRIRVDDLYWLASSGHIVGVCGNVTLFTTSVPDWHKFISFLGPFAGVTTANFLRQLRLMIPADDYVMVSCVSGGVCDDVGAAQDAGWRFIPDAGFVSGTR